MAFKVPEKYRVKSGRGASDSRAGNNGLFFIPRNNKNTPFKVVASDGMGWEHISVSLPNRCPSWEEMCMIKDLFWDDEDTVIQYHPAKSQYINNHPNCLHLWRPLDKEMPVPRKLLVGFNLKR